MMEYLTALQVADILRVKKTTVHQWILRKVDIPFVKIGRSIRFPKKDFELWVFNKTQNKMIRNFEE